MSRFARVCLCCALCMLSVACGNEFRTSHTVAVCHQAGAEAQVIEVSKADLPTHTAHGDYLARLEVDPQHPAIGDGLHFARIGDALATARVVRIGRGELREAACRITIVVASGTFRGSFDASAGAALERFPL